MKRRIKALAQLQHLARLRSDLEMRRFSAYRASVAAARDRIGQIEDELQQLYEVPEAFSISGARLTNALAGDKTRALHREESELQRMLPGFETARQAAMREFGRAEVLRELRRNLIAQDRAQRQRREE